MDENESENNGVVNISVLGFFKVILSYSNYSFSHHILLGKRVIL